MMGRILTGGFRRVKPVARATSGETATSGGIEFSRTNR